MRSGATPSRARRWLRRLGQALLVLALTAVCLVASVAIALQTSWGRERVRLIVNDALTDVFQGTIQLERIGGIHLWGVTGVDARVLDPAGQQVIALSGLQAFASLPGLAHQLIRNADRPELFIALVRVDHAEVTLRDDEDAGVTLATAFMPRGESTPEEPTDPSAGTTFIIGRIAVEHVWAHGVAGGSPPLDAELSRLRGRLQQSPAAGFSLELEGVHLAARGLPLAVDPRADLSGRVEIPAEGTGPMRLELIGDGVAARSPFTLEASWVGDWLHASATLAGVPAELLNAQVSGLALDGDVTVLADVDGTLPELDFDVELDSTAAHIRAQGNAALAEGRELLARVDLARVDASRALSGAPPTDLRAVISAVVFEQDDEQLVGSHAVLVDAGSVAGEATPALSINGAVRVIDGALRLDGVLEASESGANVHATYELDLPADGGGEVITSLTAQLDRPARLSRLGVTATGSAEFAGTLELATKALDVRASLDLARVDQGPLTARRVEARARASGSLDAPRVSATAALELLSGRARAELEYSPQRQVLSLVAADIDMLRLSELVGVKAPLKQGVLALDATLTRRAASAPLELEARGKADLGKVGSVDFEAREFEVPASTPELSRLSKLRGDVAVRGKLDLSELSPYLADAGVPLESASGKLRFELTAKQTQAAKGLELVIRLDSNALQIVAERQGPSDIETTAEAIDSRPFSLAGIDVHLAVRSELQDGFAVGTVILRDRGGTLAEVQAEAAIAELWPSRIADVGALRRMPLRALLRVPERRLGSLPTLVRPGALRGRVSVDGNFSGSLDDPRVEATITARSLRAAGSHDPVDVKALVEYAPRGGKLDVAASGTRARVEVARLTSEWRGDLRQVGELSSGRSGLSGSASLKLRDLPLEVAPQLAEQQIRGRVSGDLELRDWGRDARVLAKLSSRSLVLGKFPVRELIVDAESGAGRMRASAAIRVEAGTARAALDAGATWGAKPLPELQRRGRLTLEARALQLESLSPLLGAYVSELGGVLDASTELTVTPDRTQLAGRAKLQQGVIQLPSIGQRFSDISARVEVANDELKLEALEARGITGRVTAKGRARLDGFSLRTASLAVAIAENESIPLTIEGAALGDAWGNVQAKLDLPPDGPRRLEVDVHRFHLLTPENSGRALQSLDEPEDIRVGVRRADGAFVPLPIQPLEPGGAEEETDEPVVPLLIVVRLGRNVVVERGRTARAQLAGALEIESARETAVRGRIEVRGGRLDVSGKTFEIERGVVTFDGRDPGNPTITATARWDAPGYTVYAEYLGDVENGRIKLHSEPPLSQDEIASLLLFGSPDGSLGSGSSDNAALAVSVAGGTAAKGINQVLDDFTNLDVSARVDTTTGSARPELVFQVTPRVAAKVTRAVGAPTANESPDRTFLTLELRLKRSWALSAVVGDRGGSALDLIWRKRY